MWAIYFKGIVVTFREITKMEFYTNLNAGMQVP